MKNRIIFLLLVFSLTCCVISILFQNIKWDGNMFNNKFKTEQAFISFHPLYVFTCDNVYKVVVFEGEKVCKTVTFDSNRNCKNVKGLDLQTFDCIDDLVGKNINDIRICFGEFHTDIGSGFYIPSYITSDGFLISFTIDNEIVVDVVKRDLLKTD